MIITAGPQAAGSSSSLAAFQLKKEGVQIYSVGVGSRYKQEEVLDVASYADYVRPYSFSELPRRYFNPGKANIVRKNYECFNLTDRGANFIGIEYVLSPDCKVSKKLHDGEK